MTKIFRIKMNVTCNSQIILEEDKIYVFIVDRDGPEHD